MRLSGRLLYFVCFAALAVVAALAVARVARPSIAPLLVWSALVAALAGAPGLIHRRAWPAALLLLPVGAYLVARAQLPLPAGDHGFAAQFGFYYGQLRSGTHDYAARTFPLQLGGAAGLKLLLSLIVYGAAGVASLLALGRRRALAAIVVFLALLGFGLTVDGTGSVVALPLAFLFLAGCLLALSRSLERALGTPAGVVAGASTAVLATVLALFLLVATPVAASKPWQDWSKWGPTGEGTSRLTFDFMLNFPSLLNPKTNTKVFQVQSPVASYWRANALDYFNGRAWLSPDLLGTRLTPEGAADPHTYAVPTGGGAASGTTVLETFKLRSLSTAFLLSGGLPQVVTVDGRAPVFAAGEQTLRLRRPLDPQASYSLTATVTRLKPGELVALGRNYPTIVAADLALPFPTAGSVTRQQWLDAMNDNAADREWRGLYALNEQIVGHATDPYQITLRVEQYLRLHYAYSLALPPSRYDSPYAAFLFDTRIGYCQHFAGAMATLLRFNGIPARVAVGFATGALAGRETYVVSRNDAHAWVEAYFPGIGWVSFDPTPGDNLPGTGASSTNTGFVDPYPSDGGAGSVAASGAAPPKLQGLPGDAAAKQKSGGAGPATATTRTPDWIPWAGGLAIALLVWPVARTAVRRRGLYRGSRDRRLRAALALVSAELRDYGISVPRSQTLAETSRYLKERLDLDTTLLTDRVEAVLFGGRPADERDIADLARLRAELRRRLRARAGWTAGLRVRYGLHVAPP